MKKVFLIVFIAACMAVCAFPSLGMAFAPESKPIGNEKETKLPSFTNADGSINTSFPTQLGEYFEKHFAFRPEAISADARIRSSLFSASNNMNEKTKFQEVKAIFDAVNVKQATEEKISYYIDKCFEDIDHIRVDEKKKNPVKSLIQQLKNQLLELN